MNGDFTGKKIGPTFFRGSNPIDGVWATADVTVTHACIMPAGFGIGDHRLFNVDFQENSLLGEERFRVKQFSLWRLNSKVSEAATRRYLKQLEESLARHRLPKKLKSFQKPQIKSMLLKSWLMYFTLR